MKLRIKKGDKVIVTAGKDKGKSGKILKVVRAKNRVLVDGVNIMKKHAKRRSESDQGGLRDITLPIHASNVMLLCSSCNVGVRFSMKESGDKSKVRICKKCQKPI